MEQILKVANMSKPQRKFMMRVYGSVRNDWIYAKTNFFKTMNLGY